MAQAFLLIKETNLLNDDPQLVELKYTIGDIVYCSQIEEQIIGFYKTYNKTPLTYQLESGKSVKETEIDDNADAEVKETYTALYTPNQIVYRPYHLIDQVPRTERLCIKHYIFKNGFFTYVDNLNSVYLEEELVAE